jgi:hypothetical protein
MNFLELEFKENPGDAQGFRTSPLATIVLNDYDSGPKGEPLVTRRCDNVPDLFKEIERIEKRLLQIRVEAEAKFGAQRQTAKA